MNEHVDINHQINTFSSIWRRSILFTSSSVSAFGGNNTSDYCISEQRHGLERCLANGVYLCLSLVASDYVSTDFNIKL